MTRINYEDVNTGALSSARGSDGRLNVSSRGDLRSYYNSRDSRQTYTLPWEHVAASDGEFCFYLQNTSSRKHLVVSSVVLHSDTSGARFKLHFVEGTSSDGLVVLPTNLNATSSNEANVVAREDGGGVPIAGLTSKKVIDISSVAASVSHQMAILDRVRLGQNDAIALEFDAGSGGTADAAGVVHFYLEEF